MVEVCAKILYQVELQRGKTEHMWGFSVEAELIENADRQDELCCYVSRVEDKSVAMQNGNYLIRLLFTTPYDPIQFKEYVCVCVRMRLFLSYSIFLLSIGVIELYRSKKKQKVKY